MISKVHACKHAVLFILVATLPYATGQAQPTSEPTETEAATPFAWPSFDEAVAAATKSGKPILIDVYTPWCGWCRKMQKEVYGDDDIETYVKEHFEYGRLNIADTETSHKFKEHELTSQQLGYAFGAEGTPTTIFLQTDGTYITRLDGFWNLGSFGQAVRYIGSGAYLTEEYTEYLKSTSTNAQ